MDRNIFLVIILTALLYSPARAQLYPTQYRPPDQQWKQLKTSHFSLVFSDKTRSYASRTARILERQYQSAKKLVGGELSNFPVVLNSYNDRSNGFVTSLHFRTEIELPPIKGKSMNPQTGNWLQNVASHELVHALQFSHTGRYNLPWLTSFLSPDLARTFHGAIPSGISEGLAVYHETKAITDHGGRGNYPFFNNQFNAIFDSQSRWSMGQMLQNPAFSRPFNRHYIGGYAFTNWLQETYGANTSREAINFYVDFPFLGYGVALKHATNYWPGQLYRQFVEQKQPSENAEKPPSSAQILPVPYKGREIRRPKWLSDSTLVFYGSFYNARAGFYRYQLNTNTIRPLIITNTVKDYRYELTDHRTRLLYSYYDKDIIYDNTYRAELAAYDLNREENTELTRNMRVYSPSKTSGGLWALQSRPASSAVVSVQQDSAAELLSLDKNQIIALESRPKSDKIALIINKDGMQGLWITRQTHIQEVANRNPDVAFANGSIFDPEWHPVKNKIMFSSDFSGTFQLYEYNLEKKQVIQLTYSRYNAFEGSYSPNGSQIALIKQVVNEKLPVVMEYSPSLGEAIPADRWKYNSPIDSTSSSNSKDVLKESDWTIQPYRSGINWLKPRAVVPLIKKISGDDRYRFGLSLHSNDLLQSQAYSAGFSYFSNHVWYDIAYTNNQFYPGFKLHLYNKPSYIYIPTKDEDPTIQMLRRHQSIGLSVPFSIHFNQNIYSTSLFIEPEMRYSRLHYFDQQGGNNHSNTTNSLVSNLFIQYNYRLQQNIRDLQPNSGFILYSELEHHWNPTELALSTQKGSLKFNSEQPTALKAGFIGYFSPLREWNQSLRLEVYGLTQSGFLFDNQSNISDGFSEPIFPESHNLLSFNARYSIPLAYPDKGGFLFPFYLDAVYLGPFVNTVLAPHYTYGDSQSRSVFGIELRARLRISNLSLDVGLGFGYEPMRSQYQLYVGGY